MRHVLLTLAFLTVVTMATAREGYVETRNGNVFEGQVRFDSNAVIVVNVERLLRVEIPLTNLAGLTFLSQAEAEDPLRYSSVVDTRSLPKPWLHADLGDVRRAGDAEFRQSAFRVRSAGTNAVGTADACHWVFQPVADRCEVVTRISKVQWTDPWARAGLMMRESLDPGARSVFVSVSSARGGVFQSREATRGESVVSLTHDMAVPVWLKLKREGDDFLAFKSRNGMQWTLVERAILRMAKNYYAGLAVVAVREGTINESVFEYVELGPSVRNRWFTPEVELVSGSSRRSYIQSMDERVVSLDNPLGREVVPRTSVANIRFQPMASRFSAPLNQNRAGVILASGEFIEGDCRGMHQGRVRISSVPLGLVEYDINSEVLALVLRARNVPTRHACEVQLNDGSRWVGNGLSIESLGVTLQEPKLGKRFLFLHEIAEIRRRF